MSNKIYLDTNIFLELLVDENEFEKYKKVRSDFDNLMNTKKILYSYLAKNCRFVINTSTLTNVYFLLTERCGLSRSEVSAEFLKLEQQSKFFIVVEENKDIRVEAQEYCRTNDKDYEDVLQYFCAKYTDCDLIVTNDQDFPQLDIPLKRTNANMSDYIPMQDSGDAKESFNSLKQEFNDIFIDKKVKEQNTKKDKQ